jgi:hypothetical protein
MIFNNRNVELQREAAELAAAKSRNSRRYQDVPSKSRRQAKQLELTKQEDALVRKIKRGYDPSSNAAR